MSIRVVFIEFEVTRGNIRDWYPEFEKKCGMELPRYGSQLEGGIEQDRDGTLRVTFQGPHHCLCVPVEHVHHLLEYGNIIWKREKIVDLGQMNKNNTISYWGPGCDPTLREVYSFDLDRAELDKRDDKH